MYLDRLKFIVNSVDGACLIFYRVVIIRSILSAHIYYKYYLVRIYHFFLYPIFLKKILFSPWQGLLAFIFSY